MDTSLTFECPLPNGLHARPATALSMLAERYAANIRLVNRRNGRNASAKSVLALLSADVRGDDPCELTFAGADAAAARTALAEFVAQALPHCDDGPASPPPPTGPVPRSLALLDPRLVAGRGIGGGIGIGAPHVIAGPRIPDALLAAPGQGADAEWQRIAAAKARVQAGYEAELAQRRGTDAAVLAAHLAILKDEEYAGRLRTALFDDEREISAAQAIAGALRHFDALLGSTDNPYLRERALDVQDVSMRLLHEIYGDAASAPLPALNAPAVVVAAELTPSAFVALDKEQLRGLVLESGGTTSHTVILARAAGIPLVVDAPGAVALARSATGPLVADASAGLLVDSSGERVHAWYARRQATVAAIAARVDRYRSLAACTADGQRVEVAANIASAADAARAFAAGAEGIGLFRTEMLFMERDAPPSAEEQLAAYRAVLTAAEGRSVIVRTFDIGGDKPVPWLATVAEDNPFLGVRGVRLYPRCADVFDTQLAALLRASCGGDLRIMVPMIATACELRWVRARLEAMRERLQEAGTPVGTPRLGIMVEVPAAALALDRLAPLIDFISIGSNDLAQYFLACDRGNAGVRDLYTACHPPFLRLLRTIVDDARAHGLRTGVCGEMAGDPALLPVLVGLGVDELSMSPPSIPGAKEKLSRLRAARCRELVTSLAELEDAEAVAQALRSFESAAAQAPLFDAALVTFLPDAASKAEVIRELVDLAHAEGRTDAPAELEEAVWQREDVFSTALGFGIAVPHCKSAAVLHNSLCIARVGRPVAWGSRDGKPVDTILLLLTREADAAEAHLKVFAQLARRIMHEEFRNCLRQCENGARLVDYLRGALDVAAA